MEGRREKDKSYFLTSSVVRQFMACIVWVNTQLHDHNLKSQDNKATASKPCNVQRETILGLKQEDSLSHTYHLSMSNSSK